VVETGRGDVLFAPAGMDDPAAAWLHARVGSGRRLARAAVVVTVLALALLVPSLAAWALGASLDVVRLATAGAITGGLLTVAAAGLALGLVDDVEHREAVAIGAVEHVAVASSGPSIPWGRPVIAVLATIALAASIGSPQAPDDERSCPTAGTICHVITVQRDQVAADPRGATLDITYAVLPATGDRLGTLLFITGGPGESGLVDANWFIDGLPDEVRQRYDVLAFDPRGTGRSELRECPNNLERYGARFDAGATDVSGDFARGCAVEAGGDPRWLPTYGSEHIAGDIEAIRATLGIDRMAIYGVSYGTVIAQRYASAHPDRVSALILDGPVDPAHGSQADWVEADIAFEHTLSAVLDACGRDRACSSDLPDPQAALERMLARADGPGIVAFLADTAGQPQQITLGRGSIVDAISDALYDPTGRSLLIHALASDAKGDDVPLARLAAPAGYVSSEATSSEFAYYATLCADFAGDTAPDAASYLEAGREAGALSGVLRSVYYSGLPCVDWAGRTAGRPTPSPLTTTPFPVLVLSGGADPITPPSQAARIVSRLSDGYLFTTQDGGHGSFGNGDPCPDDAVAALLLRGERPRERQITCDGRLTGPYIPPLPAFAGLTPIEIARAIDDELWSDPDLLYQSPLPLLQSDIGCRDGGRITVQEEADGLRLTMHDCEIFAGQPMNGTVRYADAGGATYELRLPDGPLSYSFDDAGRETINGHDAGGLPPDG
jgi:pimeloyl-ACP methyl ester carboxylesterase